MFLAKLCRKFSTTEGYVLRYEAIIDLGMVPEQRHLSAVERAVDASGKRKSLNYVNSRGMQIMNCERSEHSHLPGIYYKQRTIVFFRFLFIFPGTELFHGIRFRFSFSEIVDKGPPHYLLSSVIGFIAFRIINSKRHRLYPLFTISDERFRFL
uniref:Uncharacterized protein n=1 Tax=Glossina austeni TaxID=7395 RepID=A0A1A9UUD1_GLOAU